MAQGLPNQHQHGPPQSPSFQTTAHSTLPPHPDFGGLTRSLIIPPSAAYPAWPPPRWQASASDARVTGFGLQQDFVAFDDVADSFGTEEGQEEDEILGKDVPEANAREWGGHQDSRAVISQSFDGSDLHENVSKTDLELEMREERKSTSNEASSVATPPLGPNYYENKASELKARLMAAMSKRVSEQKDGKVETALGVQVTQARGIKAAHSHTTENSTVARETAATRSTSTFSTAPSRNVSITDSDIDALLDEVRQSTDERLASAPSEYTGELQNRTPLSSRHLRAAESKVPGPSFNRKSSFTSFASSSIEQGEIRDDSSTSQKLAMGKRHNRARAAKKAKLQGTPDLSVQPESHSIDTQQKQASIAHQVHDSDFATTPAQGALISEAMISITNQPPPPNIPITVRLPGPKVAAPHPIPSKPQDAMTSTTLATIKQLGPARSSNFGGSQVSVTDRDSKATLVSQLSMKLASSGVLSSEGKASSCNSADLTSSGLLKSTPGLESTVRLGSSATFNSASKLTSSSNPNSMVISTSTANMKAASNLDSASNVKSTLNSNSTLTLNSAANLPESHDHALTREPTAKEGRLSQESPQTAFDEARAERIAQATEYKRSLLESSRAHDDRSIGNHVNGRQAEASQDDSGQAAGDQVIESHPIGNQVTEGLPFGNQTLETCLLGNNLIGNQTVANQINGSKANDNQLIGKQSNGTHVNGAQSHELSRPTSSSVAYFANVDEWLIITGYHDEAYRTKALARHHKLVELDQERAELEREAQREHEEHYHSARMQSIRPLSMDAAVVSQSIPPSYPKFSMLPPPTPTKDLADLQISSSKDTSQQPFSTNSTHKRPRSPVESIDSHKLARIDIRPFNQSASNVSGLEGRISVDNGPLTSVTTTTIATRPRSRSPLHQRRSRSRSRSPPSSYFARHLGAPPLSLPSKPQKPFRTSRGFRRALSPARRSFRSREASPDMADTCDGYAGRSRYQPLSRYDYDYDARSNGSFESGAGYRGEGYSGFYDGDGYVGGGGGGGGGVGGGGGGAGGEGGGGVGGSGRRGNSWKRKGYRGSR